MRSQSQVNKLNGEKHNNYTLLISALRVYNWKYGNAHEFCSYLIVASIGKYGFLPITYLKLCDKIHRHSYFTFAFT